MFNSKKYVQFLSLISFLTLSFFASAQLNLIPNPSFEDWDGTSGSGGNTLGGLDIWYNANGTPDHHHTSLSGNNLTALEPCPLGDGQNYCGYPVTGEAVLGCWKGNGLDGTREWAGAPLIEPMQAGNCYKVSFWIQNKKDRPDFLFETNQWGMFFSETEFPQFSADATNYTNKMDHIAMTEQVINDTIWHYIELDYQASENFEYVFVGFMGNVSEATYTAANDDNNLGFYVWFEDLSVVDITPILTVTEDADICVGDSILLTATSNYPVIWDNLAPDTTTSFWVSPTETTTYTVQTQDSTECSISKTVTVTVNPNTSIDFPEFICENADPIDLNNFYTDNGIWSGDGIVDAATGQFSPQMAGAGIAEVQFSSNVGCSEDFTLFVEINEEPTLDFQPDDFAGCAPLAVQFTNLNSENGVDYLWDFGNGNTETNPEMAAQTYNDNGEYTVSLTATYSDYCQTQTTYNNLIRVVDVPTASFSFTPNEVTNLAPEVTFTNNSSDNATQFFWNFGNDKTSTSPNPIYEYPQPGTYEVQLVVSNPEGCVDSVSQQLVVRNKVNFYAPNVFSPNFDGINDNFVVFPVGSIDTYKITIFDRWGGTVFISDDLDIAWNGLHQGNGKPVKEGIYVYVIEYGFSGSEAEGASQGVESGDVMVVK